MNKKIILTTLVFVLLISIMIFASCNSLKDLGKQDPQIGEKEVTVFIGNDEYNVKTNANYLHELLIELSTKGEIVYEYSDGPYGASISKVNGLETSITWNPYISIYHSIDDISLKDMSGYMDNVTRNDTTFYPSGVGVESIPILSGEKYLLVEISY